MTLGFDDLRVLGSLMEKEMVTPDIYPLTLNALIAACNQRSSRDPVTDLSEEHVRGALAVLDEQNLIVPARDSGRVPKYEHRVRTVLNLRRDETAVLCLLLLRGPQTPGELRSRADRMFPFNDLAQVNATLERLAARDEPLVSALARVPGSREVRWSHLLGDTAAVSVAASAPSVPESPSEIASLRRTVAKLEARVQLLEQRMGALPGRQAEDVG